MKAVVQRVGCSANYTEHFTYKGSKVITAAFFTGKAFDSLVRMPVLIVKLRSINLPVSIVTSYWPLYCLKICLWNVSSLYQKFCARLSRDLFSNDKMNASVFGSQAIFTSLLINTITIANLTMNLQSKMV